MATALFQTKGTNGPTHMAKKKKKEIYQFPWQHIHRQTKGTGCEINITMATHLEDTQGGSRTLVAVMQGINCSQFKVNNMSVLRQAGLVHM